MSNSAEPGPLDDVSLLERLHACPELFERIRSLRGNELAIQKQLRTEFADALVRAGLLLHDLRRRGAGKFSRADQMWFDRTGLEQSTSEAVARHKARRFEEAPEVVDLCSGI